MIKLKKLLKEDAGYDAAEDFFERRNEQLEQIAYFFKKSNGQGRVPWKTIPAKLLAKVWLIFGKYNRINTNDLDKISDQMLTNIAKLRASTEIMGHTPEDVRPDLEDMGYTFTDEEWEEKFPKYLTDKSGTWMISDYGLPKLERLYGTIFNAPTDEEKLYAIDKALNVIHQRSDLAALFVEGGKDTLNKIQNQGGYSSET